MFAAAIEQAPRPLRSIASQPRRRQRVLREMPKNDAPHAEERAATSASQGPFSRISREECAEID